MRDGFRCVYCGAHGAGVVLQVDHVVSVANGGTNQQDNLATACSDCNNGKGATSLTSLPNPECIAQIAQALACSGQEVPERTAAGLLGGFLNANYSLGAAHEAVLREQSFPQDWEAGEIAALVPYDAVKRARFGLALLVLLGRTDPVAKDLMQRWSDRIGEDEREAGEAAARRAEEPFE